MANVTVTTAANFIPEIWAKDVKRATEANLVMMPRVNTMFSSDIKTKGDTLHIPDLSNLTAGDKAASTDVTFEAVTEGKTDLSIDKHKYAAFKVEDIVKVQSAYDLMSLYTEKAGFALAKAMDTSLLSLYSGLSQSVGSAGTAITDANLLTAIQYLDDADAPGSQRSLVIKPSQMKALLAIDKFVRADAVGYMAQMSPIVTGALAGGNVQTAKPKGYFGQIYGIDVYVSTNVVTSGSSPVSTHNLLFHRDAFIAAVQADVRIQSDYNIRSLATEVVADVLYGVAEYRDTFAVRILT